MKALPITRSRFTARVVVRDTETRALVTLRVMRPEADALDALTTSDVAGLWLLDRLDRYSWRVWRVEAYADRDAILHAERLPFEPEALDEAGTDFEGLLDVWSRSGSPAPRPP